MRQTPHSEEDGGRRKRTFKPAEEEQIRIGAQTEPSPNAEAVTDERLLMAGTVHTSRCLTAALQIRGVGKSSRY
jgi:hypothetical protein